MYVAWSILECAAFLADRGGGGEVVERGWWRGGGGPLEIMEVGTSAWRSWMDDMKVREWYGEGQRGGQRWWVERCRARFCSYVSGRHGHWRVALRIRDGPAERAGT